VPFRNGLPGLSTDINQLNHAIDSNSREARPVAPALNAIGRRRSPSSRQPPLARSAPSE
jgi:hypothetical protein